MDQSCRELHPIIWSWSTAFPGGPHAQNAARLVAFIAAAVLVALAAPAWAASSRSFSTGSKQVRAGQRLQELPVDFHLSTGVLGVAASRVAVQRFDDMPVLGLRRVELTRSQQLLKRAFDLIVASLLLVVLSPILAACALAVRLSGPGAILFRQQRFGQDGKIFHVHKFRSMVVDAEIRQQAMRATGNEADGPLFKLHRDPRHGTA